METGKSTVVKDSVNEQEFFDRRIGKKVQMFVLGPENVRYVGLLLWVNKFNLCIKDLDDGEEIVVYKQAIESIR